MPTNRRRVTLKDVAARAGVSLMTASYTFTRPARVADATRERVHRAAGELGYHPDAVGRALKSGKTRQLGVVFGEHLVYAFDDPQAAEFLAGVAEVCVEEGQGLTFIPTRGDAGDVDRVLSSAVDAFVLWTTTEDDPVLAAVAADPRPAVIQGGPARTGIACVTQDDEEAARAIVARALRDGAAQPRAEGDSGRLRTGDASGKALTDGADPGEGRSRTPRRGGDPGEARSGDALSGADPGGGRSRRPVVISFPLDRGREAVTTTGSGLPAHVPFPVTDARLRGYRAAIEEAGLDWAVTPVAVVARNTRADGAAAARALAPRLPPDTLVIAMSDELAIGAREALRDTHPGAAYLGWDASPAAQELGIVSVANPLREQGRRCARLALHPDGNADGEIPWSITG